MHEWDVHELVQCGSCKTAISWRPRFAWCTPVLTTSMMMLPMMRICNELLRHDVLLQQTLYLGNV